MKAKLLNIYILFFSFVSIITIDVSTVEELHQAFAKVKPGQTIFIAPGVYDYSTYENRTAYIIRARGTESSPIKLTAQDPINPPLLRGPRIKDSSVIYLEGDYWIIENIKLGFSSQAIYMRNSNHNIIKNVEMFSLGSQGILLYDYSSYNLFQNCHIHSTGNHNERYGYGIVFGHKSDYNVVKGCVLRDISSEHIWVREYSTGNEIVGNIFFGDGMNGQNNADSFININGNDTYIHDNVAYRNLNRYISAAFEINKVIEDSAQGNKFVNNVLFMDRPYGERDKEKRMYIVDGVDTKFYVKNNRVDYGEGLINANSEEYYNSDSVIFLE